MRVFFLRDKHQFPVACVVSDLVSNATPDSPYAPGRVAFAVSCWNANDKFSKEDGRRIAEERLKVGKAAGFVDLAAVGRNHVKSEIIKQIATAPIIDTLTVDDKVREVRPNKATLQAAKHWLRRPSTTTANVVHLGDRVEDQVTGFVGVAVCFSKWLNGCIRVVVQPSISDKGEMRDAVAIDIEQLVVRSMGVVPSYTRVPDKPTGGPMSPALERVASAR